MGFGRQGSGLRRHVGDCLCLSYLSGMGKGARARQAGCGGRQGKVPGGYPNRRKDKIHGLHGSFIGRLLWVQAVLGGSVSFMRAFCILASVEGAGSLHPGKFGGEVVYYVALSALKQRLLENCCRICESGSVVLESADGSQHAAYASWNCGLCTIA